LKVESVTQSVCDLALRFGEGAEGEESIMVSQGRRREYRIFIFEKYRVVLLVLHYLLLE
jgi:hypothetical protein